MFPARPRVVTGLALAACSYALFATQDATVKGLVAVYAVPQILFFRSVVIMAIAFVCGGGPRALERVRHSANKPALIARASLILLAWLFYYSAAAYLGLAEITTLYFAAPVIAVALSALVLRERVGAARWSTVLLGFAGVVIAAGPLGAIMSRPALGAFAAAACWGTSTILARWISRSESTLTQMLSSNALFALGCLPVLPWMWHAPTGPALTAMLGVGIVGGVGQYLLFESYRYAPASAVAPVEYTGLVWAFLYGYAIWADIPRWNTFAGAALIAAGSLAQVWFENRRALVEPALPVP